MNNLSRNFIVDKNTDWENICMNYILPKKLIRKYQDKVNWRHISSYQKLSEKFIREFKDKVDWRWISYCQKLSEDFIKEFQDRIYWEDISHYQHLSEKFIREFEDEVDWYYISYCQKLSENFIREFKNKVNWYLISTYQNLSKEFIEEFKEKLDYKLAKEVNNQLDEEIRISRAKSYAKTHNLKVENNYLYAFRNHDKFGRGLFSKNTYYESGKTYRDWHCNPRQDIENSYGFGIFPKGNTEVRVKFEDFCVEVDREDGKARVWEFEVL